MEAQRAIDFDLNLALASAVKEAGVRTYVLFSSADGDSTSWLPYPRMKGELEGAVRRLEFDSTVFLRPGFLIGKRESYKFGEGFAQGMANFMGRVSGGRLKDAWAQDAETVARGVVGAALIGEERMEKVWVVGQADIVKWKD